MHALPADWPSLCALVFLLGIRHGLDADHLAAINGLTRLGVQQGRAHARICGALFSLGHGIVVLSIAALAGALGGQWVPPSWFEALGSLISIGFLAFLGIVNLRAVLTAAPQAVVALVGMRGRMVTQLVGRAARSHGAAAGIGIGSLFALSFDTLSQSAMFAVLGVQFGGVAHALALGLLFVLGMLVNDGANGWWISHLIGRTDRLAVVGSRVMTLVVACISLLVATIGIARMASRPFSGWTDSKELAIGAAVIALIGLSYVLACRIAALRRPQVAGTRQVASSRGVAA
jgi:nickel/cobalt transporter (NiCoT) family protein